MDPVMELSAVLLADRRRRLTDEIGRTRANRPWRRRDRRRASPVT